MLDVEATAIPAVKIITPKRFGDERGFFAETYRREALAEHGVDADFVQDNHSRSARGVIRGMHFQMAPEGASKLVRCGRGRILDVIVDLRRGAPTYAQWEGFELTDENFHMVYVPHGFGHGFCVLSEVADVVYKQSAYYDPEVEAEFSYLDPDVGIAWPEGLELVPSDRDARAPLLRDIADALPFEYTP